MTTEFELAIISGITVAIVVMFLSLLVQWVQSGEKRKSYLKTIKKQLESDKVNCSGIRSDLEDSNIPSNYDTAIYHSFLSSQYYDPDKDGKFVEKLQDHLGNIGRYQTALDRINQYAGSLTQGGGTKRSLENNIIVASKGFSEDIDKAITEIDKLIKSRF